MTVQTQVSPAARRFILFVDRLVMFVGDHWLALVNVSLFVFIALPFLAPVLLRHGYTEPAQLIYTGYKLTCHQLAYRTYFFFGEQPVYTLDQLRAALAVQNEDIFYWNNFLGNAQLGYKMAWCERDTAIYTAILVASVLFALVRSRLRPLDWRIYLLFITPMAIDGFTQLLGFRESDYLLRGITGSLFGVGSVWLIYPYLEEAMRDVQVQAKAQWQRAIEREAARNALLPQRKTL